MWSGAGAGRGFDPAAYGAKNICACLKIRFDVKLESCQGGAGSMVHVFVQHDDSCMTSTLCV